MKKHLIAAAVAGVLAVPAMAQVTIKGVLVYDPLNNQKVETQTGTAASTTVKNSQTGLTNARNWTASQLQFTGTEDLGGGLKASFVTTVDLRGEGTTGFSRDQNLALSGGFGTVRVGKFVAASAYGFHSYSGAGSASYGSFYSLGTGGAGNVNSAASVGGSFERNGNQIQYTTPNIAGLTVNASVGKNSVDDSATTGKAETDQQGLSVAYAAGPLSVGLGTNKRDVSAEGGTSEEAELTWFGASYNLGVAKITVSQAKREGSDISAAGVSTLADDFSITGVGVSVPMGAMTFRVSAFNGENGKTVATTDNEDLSGYQASVMYALSKRTSVYALIGEQKIKRASGNTAGSAITTSGNMIGLMHAF